MQRQLPAQGCPQPIVPAGAQVGGSVVVEVVLVLVVGGAKGAQSNLAGPRVTVLLPNWSCVDTAGSMLFGHFTT